MLRTRLTYEQGVVRDSGPARAVAPSAADLPRALRPCNRGTLAVPFPHSLMPLPRSVWVLLSLQPRYLLPTPNLPSSNRCCCRRPDNGISRVGSGATSRVAYGLRRQQADRQTGRQSDSSSGSAKCATLLSLGRACLVAHGDGLTEGGSSRSPTRFVHANAARARERSYNDPCTSSEFKHEIRLYQGTGSPPPSSAKCRRNAPLTPPSFACNAADMEEHPGCRYNMSASKECSSTDGSFTCETIRRVFRDCPGVRPKQVYDITTKDSGTVARSSKSPHGDDGGGDARGAADEKKMPKRDRVSLCCCCRLSWHPPERSRTRGEGG